MIFLIIVILWEVNKIIKIQKVNLNLILKKINDYIIIFLKLFICNLKL